MKDRNIAKDNNVAEPVKIVINADGRKATISSFSMTTDSWEDFEWFVSVAEMSEKKGRLRERNRALRAALLSLFAHLEGVVYRIWHLYGESMPKRYAGTRLCDLTRNIHCAAKELGRVPYINFRLGKHLRDIVVHPGIEIAFENEVLTQASVFERLRPETIRELAGMISDWLDAVCCLFEVPRFSDTESAVKHWGNVLGVVGRIDEV